MALSSSIAVRFHSEANLLNYELMPVQAVAACLRGEEMKDTLLRGPLASLRIYHDSNAKLRIAQSF